jgi:hypothetical protein
LPGIEERKDDAFNLDHARFDGPAERRRVEAAELERISLKRASQ